MKEATGELNMTVVTVVAIAAVMAFFYLIIWPTIKTGLALQSACSASNGETYTVSSGDGTITCGSGKCSFTNSEGVSGAEKECNKVTTGAGANTGGNGD